MKSKLKTLLSGRYFKRKYADIKLQKNYKDAVEQGLFNIQWYEAHCGKFATPLDGFKDYIAKSTFSNVNPSAAFDTEAYLRAHLDIYHQGVSPLLHYLQYGEIEQRRILPAHIRWHANDELLPEEGTEWQKQKVAICLHIFYADFVDKFADCLARFPISVDVFVAVSSDDIKKAVLQRYKKIPGIKKLDVVVAPNRGRNFGPLLVEFGPQLLEYDLMCHLHSKKSLYSGREQTQWFDYLNQYLFKDQHVVSCLLRLFAANPEFGMYYPTSFWMMPSWVNHWTCNKPFAQGFVDEWGIDITDNFINYPVGGMFWARPAAIKQLLETKFEYENFPDEPLPNDGSWLHALERTLGLLAEKNHYQQFFYYPAAARFTQDKSYIFANYHKPPEQLFRELRNFEVVSFDIFDTLIRREVTEPDYAKYKVGQVLAGQHLVASPQAFVEIRNNAEHALRKENNFTGDIDIHQIYQRIAGMLACDVEQANSFMQLEYCYDLELILAKDEIVKILHQLADMGREIWLVSDTYYDRIQIESMLRKAGITAGYKLYISSELGLRKDAGTMWKMLKEVVDKRQLSLIHIGDNVRSDAQVCGDYGLSNMHILHPVDKWQAAGFKQVATNNEYIDEYNIHKWGRLISNLGRYPFFGE